MLQAKQAGQSFAVPETAEPDNVVDIMDALKRSLQAGVDRRPRAPSKKAADTRAADAVEPARKSTARKTAARKAAR
jgi:non-homologous end joining protein Ku